MKADIYKDIFIPDGGALLDIRIFDVTPDDWQRLLDYLASHYAVTYEENGVPKPLPKFDVVLEKLKTTNVSLKITLPGLTVNCHLFDANQVEMDVLPEDVDSASKAESVFELMTAIARLLNKEVLLTPEFASADPEKLRSLALCSIDPKTGDIKCYPQHQ
jgi:hypothetical protein